MKKLVLLALLYISFSATAQNKVYINLGSHNEMKDENYNTDQAEYDTTVARMEEILSLVETRNAKWNYQTCSKFVLGALNFQNAHIDTTDILEKMYRSGRVEIDPRNKTEGLIYKYNIADTYHLLDSCGVPSTHNVGGFLYYPYNKQDWSGYVDTIEGVIYPHINWKAEVLWGAGSTPPHTHDANNYGIWKPGGANDSVSFFTHTPNQTVWIQGNGCAPVLYDTTTDPQWIINLIRAEVNNVYNGVYPTDGFYCLTFMCNTRDYDSPGFITKLTTVIDSIAVFVAAGKAEWATISEKQTAFNNWLNTTSKTHSQWWCGQAPTTIERLQNDISFSVYPNPFKNNLRIEWLGGEQKYTYELFNYTGQLISTGTIIKNQNTYFPNMAEGIYDLRIIGNAGVVKNIKLSHAN